MNQVALGPASTDLGAEARLRLQQYLRVDTTNPPGHEHAAARLLASWLEAEGIAATVYEPAPGRANLVARLPGDGSLPPLMLLHHMDVVPADADRWSHPAFSGHDEGGVLWGRGALDMKGLGIMQLVAFVELKRRAANLARDVIFCAVADEETTSEYGARWLLEHHPDEIAADDVWNEGSVGLLGPHGEHLFGIATAERGSLWVKVTAHGEPGHGSVDRPDSATRRLIRALARLEGPLHNLELSVESQNTLRLLGQMQGGLEGWLLGNLHRPLMLRLFGPLIARKEPLLSSILASTCNTTVLAAGSNVNVMPAQASALIDIRMLPGHGPDDELAWLERTLGDPGLTFEVIEARPPTRSASQGPLYDAISDALRAEYPGCAVEPIVTPTGTTDSAFFRLLGARASGLLPIVAPLEQLKTMHGDDERITHDQIDRGTRVVVSAVRQAATARGSAKQQPF